jgi:hypothetical protein
VSKHELVEAYLTGKIGRRAFIRGLVALGVSASAAATHATLLGPAAAAGPGAARRSAARFQTANELYPTDPDTGGPVTVVGGDIDVGNGGTAVADASGGTVTGGDIVTGGNTGTTVEVGDTIAGAGEDATVSVDGGSTANKGTIDVGTDGGTATSDASGRDGNVVDDEARGR